MKAVNYTYEFNKNIIIWEALIAGFKVISIAYYRIVI
jgi:hypothetical protein